jgi:hypothetical protein
MSHSKGEDQEPEGEAAPRSEARLPGPKALAWIMAMPRARRSAPEAAILLRVLQDAEAAILHGLVQRFAALVREAGVSCCSSAANCAERVRTFEAWAVEARACGIRAAQTFAAGLVADGAAVRAALTTPWSNAQAEGQITKLKLIKRLMYGRAGFELLRRRVLLAA